MDRRERKAAIVSAAAFRDSVSREARWRTPAKKPGLPVTPYPFRQIDPKSAAIALK
ncbi:hypothetical protein TAL182_CH00216 [Rhizobium sp. TAL182]|nr:hypothetical protein TAL182_CH00216 [Rhizobium sp. TAL182]